LIGIDALWKDLAEGTRVAVAVHPVRYPALTVR